MCWVAFTLLTVRILEFKAMQFTQSGCNYTFTPSQHKDSMLYPAFMAKRSRSSKTLDYGRGGPEFESRQGHLFEQNMGSLGKRLIRYLRKTPSFGS